MTSQGGYTGVLIQGGEIVNDERMFKGDVYFEEGKIRQIGVNLSVPNSTTKIIDATGLFVMPGGIDTHTHLNGFFMQAESVDDFCRGTRAALAGGTTMILDMALDSTQSMSPIEEYKHWRKMADPSVCCDYGLHVCITHWNEGTSKEMSILTNQMGINSFKMFMAYKEALMLNDADLIASFQACQKYGALAQVHAENGDAIFVNQKKIKDLGITGPEGHLYSRPEELEAEATNRAIVLADQVDCPLYVVHVMAKSAADVIATKRREGYVVFGEPIAAGLGTDGTNYFSSCWRHAACHVLSPPLRPDPSTPTYLMDKLACGDLECTGTDHCTFSSSQKALGAEDFTKIPNGINGVQERMSIIWEKGVMSGKLSPSQFVAVTSANAAKVFNIYPQKGRIDVGSDADIVVWDPDRQQVFSAETHVSASDFNIFEGMECRGFPVHVFTRGRHVVDFGKVYGEPGSGRFVPTEPFCSYVYGPMKVRAEGRVPRKIHRLPYMAA